MCQTEVVESLRLKLINKIITCCTCTKVSMWCRLKAQIEIIKFIPWLGSLSCALNIAKMGKFGLYLSVNDKIAFIRYTPGERDQEISLRENIPEYLERVLTYYEGITSLHTYPITPLTSWAHVRNKPRHIALSANTSIHLSVIPKIRISELTLFAHFRLGFFPLGTLNATLNGVGSFPILTNCSIHLNLCDFKVSIMLGPS